MKLFGKEKIQNLKIFNGIDATVVDEIIQQSQRQNFMPWEIIIQQGDYPNSTGYIIEEGNVDVWVNEDQTAKLDEWEMFWEIALLNEEPRTASIVAKTDVTTIVITQDMLFEMINNDDNSINKEIMRRMEENLLSEES